ncbi:MAG: beta-ketoacyl-[acyl-carrier-protein] synthase family protein [Chryseolinea sp.]
MEAPVHVAGIGVISPIGATVEETMLSFRESRSGIGRLSLFDSVHQDTLPVGEVKLSNEELAATLSTSGVFPRTALLGIYAARQAVKNAGIDFGRWRTGLISATTVGGMDRTKSFFIDFLNNESAGRLRDVRNHECGSTTEIIADDLGVKGFISTINTACSSSVNAIALGTRLLRNNMLDVVIAGGADALSKFTLNGFNSLMILDSQPCKPFDARRNGLNLGEGAGFVVLVSERVLRSENVKSHCVVGGFANTNDAFHQTASSPEGRGSYGAMVGALQMGGLDATEISYVNLHGTGTLNNDLSEGTAVRRLYGDHYPPLSSTKAFTGHTLGASGGIEAVFSILAIKHQCILPNLRFELPIPDIDIRPQTVFKTSMTINHVMSNSFGFGGNCSSIIFSKG